MKTIYPKAMLLLGFGFLCLASNAQNVGIGTTAPDASAALHVSATNKGLLVPQVNLQNPTDATTVPAPAASLLVYNTNITLGVGYYYNAGTTISPSWIKLATSSSGSTGWSLTGNSGTTAANFIGTTDDHTTNNPLRFAVNGGSAGMIDSALYNTGLGLGTLRNNTIGNFNTANGALALYSNANGSNNTATGGYALNRNNAGNANTAYGFQALASNTAGSYNTAIGDGSLGGNANGINNTTIGFQALASNTSGNNNVAIGFSAGTLISAGSSNIFIGANVSYNVSNTASNQLNIGNWLYGNNGKIGIGSGNAINPTRAQLVVDGNVSQVFGTYGYLSQTGTGTGTSATVNTSIWASDRVVAQEFDATSDMRIKRNIVPLTNGSLSTLAKINVVSYDKLNKGGTSSEIGVLGQELEKILPTAVKQSEGDIYNDATQQWEVVKDFRTVNYQSINLLTTKAVQELNGKVNNQQLQIATLQKDNTELKALVKQLLDRK